MRYNGLGRTMLTRASPKRFFVKGSGHYGRRIIQGLNPNLRNLEAD